MKHIVSNPYHLWAHETQEWAANSTRNCSFQGASAYSYHAEIGRIVRNAKKQRAFLVSTCTWSVTTSGHQSAMRSAIPRGEIIFHVAQIEYPGSRDHVQEYMEKIADLAGKVARARRCKEWRQAELLRVVEELRKYVAFFKIKGVKVPDDGAIDAMREQLAEFQKAEHARERAAEKKRLAEAQEVLADWMAGNNVWVPSLGQDFLRVSPSDPATVETTQRASVPLEHVQRALPVVLRKFREGVAWHPNGETIRLGYYSVSGIRDGVLTVGCHKFTRAEVERFAEVLKSLAA